MSTAEKLDESVFLLKESLTALETAVETMKNKTRDVSALQQILHTNTIFDLLPERVVLQRPLKIRKIVKPIIEKDRKSLSILLERYKNKKQVLQQQSKIMKLKLETIDS